MNKIIQKQMSDSFLTGALLTIVGGFLDAYTYIVRGKVFANAQTGNMILLGVNFSKGQFHKVLLYALPIFAFIFGVILTEVIQYRYKNNTNIHWRQIILFIEALILFLVSFIPNGPFNVIANILISFLCAMQYEAFKKINGNFVATTMCTGNLRTGTALIFQFFLTKDKTIGNKIIQYFSIIIIFIIGAVLGTFFTNIFQVKAIYFCCLLIVVTIAVMLIKEEPQN